jgi:hypothetical protein
MTIYCPRCHTVNIAKGPLRGYQCQNLLCQYEWDE